MVLRMALRRDIRSSAVLGLYGIRRELDREGLRADKLKGIWQFDGCIPVAIVTDYRAYSLTSR